MEHTGALGPLAHKTINELANKWSTPGNLQPPERKLLIARLTRFLTAWLSCSLQRSLAHTILACGAVADHSQSDMWHLDETCIPHPVGGRRPPSRLQRFSAAELVHATSRYLFRISFLSYLSFLFAIFTLLSHPLLLLYPPLLLSSALLSSLFPGVYTSL